MTIAVGDKVPDVKLVKASADGIEPVQTTDFFAGRKVVLFSVPGAFTPTCSAKHLPGFVAKAAELKAKGVEFVLEPMQMRPDLRIAFVRGPDDVRIELLERKSA